MVQSLFKPEKNSTDFKPVSNKCRSEACLNSPIGKAPYNFIPANDCTNSLIISGNDDVS